MKQKKMFDFRASESLLDFCFEVFVKDGAWAFFGMMLYLIEPMRGIAIICIICGLFSAGNDIYDGIKMLINKIKTNSIY